MKKDLAVIFGLFLIVIILIVFGKGYTSIGQIGLGKSQATDSATTKETTEVKIRSLAVAAKVANTSAERKQGLSNLESLPLGEGMLFVFESEGKYGIWMKDMKFAIDIAWIDKDRKIVDMAKNIAPEPGKNERGLTIYKPQFGAVYVLEVNAGLLALHGIQVGDTVEF